MTTVVYGLSNGKQKLILLKISQHLKFIKVRSLGLNNTQLQSNELHIIYICIVWNNFNELVSVSHQDFSKSKKHKYYY